MTLDAHALSRLKVKDLQRELKKRGLDTTGLKAVLLKRLKEHLEQEENATVADVKPKEKADNEEAEAPAKEEEPRENSDAEQEGESEQPEKSQKTEGGEPEAVEKESQKAETPASPADEEDKSDKLEKKDSTADQDQDGGEHKAGTKRSADELTTDEDTEASSKKAKTSDKDSNGGSHPAEKENDKPASDASDEEKAAKDEADATGDQVTTLRIDNFVRPFTLNAVKALVQEFGEFVNKGFWMDVIKTHCFVTYPNADIAKKTSTALDGKVWPAENGRALKVAFVDQTAMDIATNGEQAASRVHDDDSDKSQPTKRQKVTIDEFFLKTEAKPVLYYLPLTDEQVEQRKQRQPQRQDEGQPRKRRRGGRKRRNRNRFRR